MKNDENKNSKGTIKKKKKEKRKLRFEDYKHCLEGT